MQPTLQLWATLDPLTYCARPGIEPAGHGAAEKDTDNPVVPQQELLFTPFLS